MGYTAKRIIEKGIDLNLRFDWLGSCSKSVSVVNTSVSSSTLSCDEHGFCEFIQSGIWLAFNSERMTSKNIREISAMSGPEVNNFQVNKLLDYYL